MKWIVLPCAIRLKEMFIQVRRLTESAHMQPTRASSAGATRKMGEDPIHAESRQSWSTFAQESVDQLTESRPWRGVPVLQGIWVRIKGQKLNSMPSVRWHR